MERTSSCVMSYGVLHALIMRAGKLFCGFYLLNVKVQSCLLGSVRGAFLYDLNRIEVQIFF